ncbi:VanZ family protein [Jeotgalibacillus haloalkalitolerans]|uniref:VanZ family protein n=1 Tax=Jeotgalibacillus haloalkalitolerans TaxID=3104292 RepID=A0ABU5KJH8_9BACL|nr:VanZ family protein [Jeotgalibacillus sp. HH7-29]MDZ5711378.1 VanZ family protein [Jeotgalibacillus sp. HH7-29]
MKKLMLTVWMLLICIGVFTGDVGALLSRGQVSFNINPAPSGNMYFQLYPLFHASFFEMTGHFFMFSVLTYLVYINFKQLHLTFLIALIFAVTTELLQPFFGRGADLYDLLANMIGIFLVVFLIAAEAGTDPASSGE